MPETECDRVDGCPTVAQGQFQVRAILADAALGPDLRAAGEEDRRRIPLPAGFQAGNPAVQIPGKFRYPDLRIDGENGTKRPAAQCFPRQLFQPFP